MSLNKLLSFTQPLLRGISKATVQSDTTGDVLLSENFHFPESDEEGYQNWVQMHTSIWAKIEANPEVSNWKDISAELKWLHHDEWTWETIYRHYIPEWKKHTRALETRGQFGRVLDRESKEMLWTAMFYKFLADFSSHTDGKHIEYSPYLRRCEKILKSLDLDTYQSLPRYWPPDQEVDRMVTQEWCLALSAEERKRYGSLYRYWTLKRLELRDAQE